MGLRFLDVSEEFSRVEFGDSWVKLENLDGLWLDLTRNDSEWVRKTKPRRFDMNYRHMCRYHSSTIMRMSALRRYSHLLHVDSDASLLCRPDGPDPLEVLASTDDVYGIFEAGLEDPMYSKGFSTFLREYMFLHEIEPAVPRHWLSTKHRWLQRTNPYTGSDIENISVDEFATTWGTAWEVLDLRFFNSPNVLEFTRKLEKSLGHYRYNWGDHLIRAYQVQLFAPLSGVRCFDAAELPGSHGCAGVDDEFGSDIVYSFHDNLSCPHAWMDHWIWGVPWSPEFHELRDCTRQCNDIGCAGVDVIFKADFTAECRLRAAHGSQDACHSDGPAGDAGRAWMEAPGSTVKAGDIALLGTLNRFQLIERSHNRSFRCSEWLTHRQEADDGFSRAEL